jgi:hypothetical protein
VFNPNQVARPHLFGNPRQQSATLAEVGSYYLLSERMTSSFSAIYSNDKARVFSRVLRIAALAGLTLLLVFFSENLVYALCQSEECLFVSFSTSLVHRLP